MERQLLVCYNSFGYKDILWGLLPPGFVKTHFNGLFIYSDLSKFPSIILKILYSEGIITCVFKFDEFSLSAFGLHYIDGYIITSNITMSVYT